MLSNTKSILSKSSIFLILAIFACQGEAIDVAADDALEDMSVFAIGRIEDECVRGGREPVAERAKDQIRGSGARQNMAGRDAARVRDGFDQAVAGGRW